LRGDRLELAPVLANDDGLVTGLVDQNRGGNPARLPFGFEALDLDRGGLGEFLTE
jgi:hypothetical protein